MDLLGCLPQEEVLWLRVCRKVMYQTVGAFMLKRETFLFLEGEDSGEVGTGGLVLRGGKKWIQVDPWSSLDLWRWCGERQ